MLRVAVLGAGGFLGCHLVPKLLELEGVSVDAIDLELRKLELERAAPRLRCTVADVRERAVLERAVDENDVVFSLTALCTPALYNADPLAVIDANYTHLVPLVARAAERGKRLLHFSTCEVYGRMALDADGRPSERMQEEETALFLGPVQRERWSYACAKQLLERVIWAHGKHRQLDFTIVRPFNVIGPKMDFLPGLDGEGVPRVLACFMNALLRGEPLRLVEGGEQRRSFISVQDFVTGVVAILLRGEACRGQIVNLGNPKNELSIRELAEALAQEFARQAPDRPLAGFQRVSAQEFYGEGYDDSQRRVPDIGKAERLLGFAPRDSLADMLPGIVRDYVARYGQSLAQPAARRVSAR